MDSRNIQLGVVDTISVRDFEDYFEIQRKCIARGELCEIRLCKDQRTGEMRTVKVFRKSDLNEQAIQLINKELVLLSKLDHPNIVKVHGAYQDQFKIYFVIDTFKGGSLFDRTIKHGQLTEVDSAMIVSNLFSALKHMHKNGYVHRNLRPETILFESESAISDIKIVDFITAIETKDITEEDNIFDQFIKTSFHYRCPELLMQRKLYDTKCDLWSTGIILYNMITGIPPFFEASEEATQEKIKQGHFSCQYPNYEENTTPEIKELINSLLMINKIDRISIDTALRHPWIQSNTKAFLNINKKIAHDTYNNMKSLFFGYNFQKAALVFMAKNLIDKSEKNSLQILFEYFDENRDGDVTLKEFISCFKTKFNILIGEGEMAKIIRQIDLNADREISFTEFILGACNKQALLSENNLRIAFAYIDADKDGFITREDLKEFCGINDDTYIGIMIEEADDDCDGGLHYKEFSTLMLKLLKGYQ